MTEISEKCKTRYWRQLDDGRVERTLCPRLCQPEKKAWGLLRANGRVGPDMLTAYGQSSGLVDPVEKKPLFHFLPGTPVLSFGTVGCNLTCRFCQNWDISKSRDSATLQVAAITGANREYGSAVRMPQCCLYL